MSPQELQKLVDHANEEARVREGDEAPFFFVVNGMVDMIEPGQARSEGGVARADILSVACDSSSHNDPL